MTASTSFWERVSVMIGIWFSWLGKASIVQLSSDNALGLIEGTCDSSFGEISYPSTISNLKQIESSWSSSVSFHSGITSLKKRQVNYLIFQVNAF